MSTASSKHTDKRHPERSLQLALAAAQTAEDDRAQDVLVLDTRKLTSMFDYLVLATGTSRRQLHAISEDIDHCLEDEYQDRRQGIEGYRESRWIVLDYGSIVIHIFDEEMRAFYNLEGLWADAEVVAREPSRDAARDAARNPAPNSSPSV